MSPVVGDTTTTLVSFPDGTGSYGNAVTFTATVGASGVPATGTVTIIPGSGTFASPNAGTRAITATGYALNYAIGYETGALTLNPADQAITFGSLAAKTYGSGPLALTATADSELPVSYISSDPTVASVAGSIVTLLKAGSTTMTASQPGDTNYNAAAPVAQTLTVDAAATITTMSISDSPCTYGDSVTLTASVVPASSSGTVQLYQNAGALGSPVPLSSGQAQLVTRTLATGSHSITATYSGSTNYNGSTATAMTQTVDQATPTITTPPSATEITCGQTLASSTLDGGAASVPGTFAFTTPAIVPPIGTASHSVTFTPSDTTNYQTATTSVSVVVNVVQTTFEAWAADPTQGLTAGEDDGPLDDPDRDGFSNLLEFALGGAPMESSQVIRPMLTQVGGNWVFSFDRSHLAKSATIQVVEYGSDLTGWTPLTIPPDPAGPVAIIPGTSSDHVEVSVPPQGANGFVRLKVSPCLTFRTSCGCGQHHRSRRVVEPPMADDSTAWPAPTPAVAGVGGGAEPGLALGFQGLGLCHLKAEELSIFGRGDGD